jgi:hypothetical protein
MKHIFFAMITANAAIILSLGSCTKESLSRSVISDSTDSTDSTIVIPDSTHYPVAINNVVAGRWIKNESGYYHSVVPAVPSNINTSNHTTNIYLVANRKETLINQSISYLGGTLWAEVSGGNLQLAFLPRDNILPFSYLVFKVVIL